MRCTRAGRRTTACLSTLDALLASRIDALEPGERDVLSRAAVAGRGFSAVGSACDHAGAGAAGAGRPARVARPASARAAERRRARVRAPARPPGGVSRDRASRARGHARAARAMAGRRGRGRRGRRRAPRTCGGRLDSRRAIATRWSREAAELLGGAGFRALMAADHAAAANLLGRAAALLPDDDPARMELECTLRRRRSEAWASPTSGSHSSRASWSERQRAGERRLELRAEVELVHSELEAGTCSGRSTPRSSWRLRSPSSAEAGDTLGVARAEYAYVVGRSATGQARRRRPRARPAHARRVRAPRVPGSGRHRTTVTFAMVGGTQLDGRR